MKNCYNCFFGGNGEEVNDRGHCWKHNGEPDFRQPPRDDGCSEWLPPRNEENKIIVRCRDGCSRCSFDPGSYWEPPSSECGVPDDRFEELWISPEAGELDAGDYPDCPFFLPFDEIESEFWKMHYGEILTPDPAFVDIEKTLYQAGGE